MLFYNAKKRLREAIDNKVIDVEMLPYLERLNRLIGFQTLWCCSGHGAQGYILFVAPEPEDLVTQLNIKYYIEPAWAEWPIVPQTYYTDAIPRGVIHRQVLPAIIVDSSVEHPRSIKLLFNTLEELDVVITRIEIVSKKVKVKAA